MLCLSDCWTDNRTALNIVKEWLNTPYAKSALTLRALTKLKTIEAGQFEQSESKAKDTSEGLIEIECPGWLSDDEIARKF